MNSNEFISIIAPIAVQLRTEGSFIFPSVRIAQAALETGWEIHPWNNLVGFKVGTRPPNDYWKGSYVNKGTWEVYDGVRKDVTANFRAYDSIADCFRDQDMLFLYNRYDRVRAAKTPIEQANMLYACGYATDPQYSQKIINLIFMYDLKNHDREAELMEKLKNEIEALKKQVQQLQANQSMDVPEWAKTAVVAATETNGIDGKSLVDTPDGGSYDFYRVLTVLYRAGIIRIPKTMKEKYPHHFS